MTLVFLAAIAVGAPFTVLAIGMVVSVLAAPWMSEDRREAAHISAQDLIGLAKVMRSGGRAASKREYTDRKLSS